MSIKVMGVINPTDKDFSSKFSGEDVFIPAGKTVMLPEACAFDVAYYLAQRILQSQGKPFFGEEHALCQAELIGLSEPTFFAAKVVKVTEVKTRTGKIKNVEVEIEDKDLVETEEAPEVFLPEEETAPVIQKDGKSTVGSVVLDD